ncbi:AraC family transcriptional regulator [Sphingobacterium wenxiniae]|uniref:AraC-type DNA-binding protein n=1 Tax=Sphingobacterium wenxiniae TaxID=683125 RepID=A0A1I6VL36_9SPHI|nr:AraC family transcriptional regulator [Sphingobacterium wenxiniae]SFT14432.1 AraC-type DNA-binding protein [Sphingobacterium wenxiniae]
MKKVQFEQLVIHDYEEKTFHLPVHSHTYYELVYIRKGKGIHLLNSSRLPYKRGDIFIISPEDKHYFEIAESTHFTFIKFTDDYFSGHKIYYQADAFISLTPENIMRNKLLKEVKLKMDEPCISILKNTIENIVAYNCRKDIAQSPLMFYQILSIFGLIKEAAAKLNIRIDNGQPEKEELISYIHQHIYEPSLIQIKSIAVHFAISPTYFSDYFKKKFGISYRDYINSYRTKLIEKRLSVPSLTMKEIANEFGFSDVSHLNRSFKKNNGVNPSAFKKSVSK